VHVLHDEKELVAGAHNVERLHDIRVLDARHDARFVEQHADVLGAIRVRRTQTLDGDRSAEASQPDEARQVHLRKATGRDDVEKHVAFGNHFHGLHSPLRVEGIAVLDGIVSHPALSHHDCEQGQD
jgi:hypothetical protein